MINLDKISFSYSGQDRACLCDISLTIADGESLCLMGSNGCGKSTLAKIIAGLARPSSGRVEILEPETTDYSLPIGLLFQDPDNQMVAAVVDKEIAFSLENLSTPVATMASVIESELKRFQIVLLRSRLTTELSGGEKQRVALASVMVTDPHVLILDEPDSYLDEQGRRILHEELRRLHQEHPNLVELRITQYPHIARRYKRLIVMFDGQIVADGEPSKILADWDSLMKWGLAFDPEDKARVSIPASDGTETYEVRSVDLAGVGFGYLTGIPVFEKLNLRWERGEIIGVVGPSGSGKSTFGHLLCGLMKPSHGAVSFLGKQQEKIEIRNRAGLVAGIFQQPERQFFLGTCREEVNFGPANLGHALKPSEAEAFLSAVGLDPSTFLGRDPFTLSMGEKRRLAFAAVLSMSPQFVVFDEPTCALDPEGVGRFVLLSRALKARGVGQMIVSHDPDVINLLAERVLYFPGDGSVSELTREGWFSTASYREVMPLPTR
jgi:energy-coupling factor transporter ATP-binding protein EcfA2